MNIYPQPNIPGYDQLIKKLVDFDAQRIGFLRGCLSRLGLEVSADDTLVPPLSPLHLSSMKSSDVTEMLCAWEEIIEKENGEEYIRGETDTFHIQNLDTRWSTESLRQALPSDNPGPDTDAGIVDYTSVTKKIIPHEESYPHPKSTPQFSHDLYFSSLKRYRQIEPDAEGWGSTLMYGEVVTSTNTLLQQ